MRVRALLVTLVIPAFGAGITACGRQATRRVPQVRLELRSPADGTRVYGSSITVSGSVSPARAQVQVLGRRASVKADGSFSARIALRTGVNLIDVLASLPHSSGAMSALRVERYVLVAVPQVEGQSLSDAEAALRAAGLVPARQSADDAFTSLLPLPEQVCSVSPQPGTQVSPGSTVTITTSKLCGVSNATAQVVPPAPAANAAAPAAGGPGHGNGNGPDSTGPPGQDKAGPPGHQHGSHGNQGAGGGD